MTWIALADCAGRDHWVVPNLREMQAMPGDRIMRTGTVLFETRIAHTGKPQVLIDLPADDRPGATGLSVQVLPHGGVVLVMTDGDTAVHKVLDRVADTRTDTICIALSWDSDAQSAWLSVTQPEVGIAHMIQFDCPMPQDQLSLLSLVKPIGRARIDADVVFIAVSDKVEPVGPMPSLSGSVPVETAHGPRAVGLLKPGDLVRTVNGALSPVLQVVRRIVPSLGAFKPVRIRAPYFGLRQDIVVDQHQRLLIGGPEVEYIFGREKVLIPATSLLSGYAARFEPAPRFVEYVQLLLPEHDAMQIPDAALESLYIGRLRRRPMDVAMSVLGGVPRATLPEHHRKGHQVLKAFEAITLAEARAA